MFELRREREFSCTHTTPKRYFCCWCKHRASLHVSQWKIFGKCGIEKGKAYMQTPLKSHAIKRSADAVKDLKSENIFYLACDVRRWSVFWRFFFAEIFLLRKRNEFFYCCSRVEASLKRKDVNRLKITFWILFL